jgi:hypothetical protein
VKCLRQVSSVNDDALIIAITKFIYHGITRNHIAEFGFARPKHLTMDTSWKVCFAICPLDFEEAS